MVCRGIFTPMTHRSMASVVLIPPTSSICGPSQRVASVTLPIVLDEMQSTAAQFIQVRVHLVFLLSQIEIPSIDCNPFVIGADAVQPKNEVRDLGIVLDRDLTMTSHITGLVRTSFAILRQLPRQQKFRAMNGAHLANPIRGELGYAHWPQLGTQFIALLGTKFGAH